ncbi:MAG TPA: MarR family transcriptional regulator [Terriglobales bacterium]|nr:MarR family transcriptional regulator [Terriglobales bacterium]
MSRPATGKFRGVEAVADRLHSAAIRLLRRLRLQDAAMGIGPAQASALSVLVFGGPMSLKELARAEQVRPATMSRVVRGLERAKLVRRATAGDDARRIVLTPTEEGKSLLWEGRRRRVALLASGLRALAPEEQKQLAQTAELLHLLLPKLEIRRG